MAIAVTTTPVALDFLQANEIIAALEQRRRTLEGHVQNGVHDDVLARAIRRTQAAEDAVRAAFRLPTEDELDALHEATLREMEELREAGDDSPLAAFPLSLVAYADRGDEYRTRGA